MAKFGRKPCLLYTNIPWIIGWSFLITATNFWTFILGSVLVGFSSGSMTSVICVYNSEIPQPDLRGFFCGFVNVTFNTGILISHCFGIMFSWRISLALCAIFPILCFIFTLFIPESPNWLILNGNPEKARKIFFNLRGYNDQSHHEFETLLNRRENNVQRIERGTLSNLFSKTFFIPSGILITMFTVQICTGNDLICFYAVDIIQKMSSKIDTEVAILSIDVIRLISTTISCMLIEKYSRRSLFFLSTGSTVFAMMALIGVMHSEQPGIVLTISLCTFMFTMNLGLGPIPWVMIAEVSI